MTGSDGRPAIRIRARGARRLRSGHPWVFRDDVADGGGARHGDTVRVLGPAGEPIGWAFWSSRSKIAVRFVGSSDPPPDRTFWASRIDEAIAWRSRAAPEFEALRLVHGESDGVPGLVADLYGSHLVVQVLTAATERHLEILIEEIRERRSVDSVLARNDVAVRVLEGLPREVIQLDGTTPERIEVAEDGIRYIVDPWRGQKTGAFLDQRANRIAAASYAGGRVLDVFAYHGSFALHAARRGGTVVAVDASREALARARDNAVLNGASNVDFVEANAFDELRRRDRDGERFDCVFVDPPAFAKRRADLVEARRGYKEINLRAMRLLEPNGTLVTSSCSYNLGEADFVEVLADAAADARAAFRIVERRGQSPDHPVRLGFPESHYLKCLVLSRCR